MELLRHEVLHPSTTKTGTVTLTRECHRLQYLIRSLFILLSILNPVRGDDHGVTFLFPTRGIAFHYLDIVNVTYLSPFPHPNLYTFCDGGSRQGQLDRPYLPYCLRVLIQDRLTCR